MAEASEPKPAAKKVGKDPASGGTEVKQTKTGGDHQPEKAKKVSTSPTAADTKPAERPAEARRGPERGRGAPPRRRGAKPPPRRRTERVGVSAPAEPASGGPAPGVRAETKPKLPPVKPISEFEFEPTSPEEFEKLLPLYESTFKTVREGELVKGRVLRITRDDVFLDVGFKSEGIIPLVEFGENPEVKPGDEIDVFLESFEDQNGQLVLSKQKADFMRVWDNIKEASDRNQPITGRAVRRIKGGLVVDLMGVEAFLPGSQIALRQQFDVDTLLGQALEFKIIKLNKARRNIVVSRRAVLEEQREVMKSKLLAEMAVGQTREGYIKNITDFGVFVDLGGVDGLLHITDMAWGRVGHPSEMVNVGQKINVKILDFDKNTGRISLGLKQLTPYPWENVEQKFPVGSRVRGRVTSITDYGAFVELEKGLEGLVHISEMSWTHHVKHPSKILSANDVIEAVVLNVDREHEKISLGLKQLTADPWDTLELRYPVGIKVTGKVRNLTPFGAFVEVEEGIDGLIHVSDMSWTRRIQHPSEVLKKNDVVEVKVLHIDKENRRISLGLKQVQEDPWPKLAEKYRQGTEVEGKVMRLLERGVVVDIQNELEGFVPLNHLGVSDLAKPQDAFKEGETIPLRVLEFDQSGRRLMLSVDAYFQNRDKKELEEYRSKHPVKKAKEEPVGAAQEKEEQG